jgi:alkylation response protein AidB-like acyl-CoA dehydrogenase
VALKNGSSYVLNGQKDYVTSQLTPDLALCLAITDQETSTDDRFSMVAVDTTGPDVLIRASNLLTPGAEQTIYMTDVFAPLNNLIGEEGQGLEIANMMLDIERGGIGVPLKLQREIEWKEKQTRDNMQN